MESEKNLKGSKVELNDVKKTRSGKLRIMDCGCFGSSDYGHPTVEKVDEEGNVDMESANSGGFKQHSPTHLVVMVNGLIGSAQNWRFAAKQFFKKYPKDLIVHCSQCNSALATLDGIDVMGSRLADEVRSVIERHPNLQKISFIGHSLGGLIARYAIAKLYTDDYTNQVCQLNGDCKSVASDDLSSEHVSNGKIAGLEPINFITVATPHLGSRGRKQVPMFCGLKGLEKVGFYTSGILKRTGRHVYLKDKPNGRLPLLVQMANDTEELKFISALQSFKRQVVYANVLSDHLVGWSTSSIRLQSELPKRKNLERSNRYPHILKEGAANMTNQEVSTNSHTNRHKSKTATMEETMIKGLSKVKWERVDVSFKGSKQRYFAHNTIQIFIRECKPPRKMVSLLLDLEYKEASNMTLEVKEFGPTLMLISIANGTRM